MKKTSSRCSITVYWPVNDFTRAFKVLRSVLSSCLLSSRLLSSSLPSLSLLCLHYHDLKFFIFFYLFMLKYPLFLIAFIIVVIALSVQLSWFCAVNFTENRQKAFTKLNSSTARVVGSGTDKYMGKWLTLVMMTVTMKRPRRWWSLC